MNGGATVHRMRRGDAGITLVEILIVLVLIGVAASVVGLSINGGGRAAGPAEREATLLAVRLERAGGTSLERGIPAGFIWDGAGYAFVSLEDGTWSPHPDVVLGTPHKTAAGIELSAMGQRQGRYLIRPDLLPSGTTREDEIAVALTVDVYASKGAWKVVFDGAAAEANPAGTGRP